MVFNVDDQKEGGWSILVETYRLVWYGEGDENTIVTNESYPLQNLDNLFPMQRHTSVVD